MMPILDEDGDDFRVQTNRIERKLNFIADLVMCILSGGLVAALYWLLTPHGSNGFAFFICWIALTVVANWLRDRYQNTH